MPNYANTFLITTKTILDKTILDADVNDAANITRSKINESQALNVKGGQRIYLFDSTNVKNLQAYHTGIYALIMSNVGDIWLTPQSAVVAMGYSGSTCVIRLLDPTLTKAITMKHDGTNGLVETEAGDLVLSPSVNIQSKKPLLCTEDVEIRAGKLLKAYDSGNLKKISLKHDGVQGIIEIDSGRLLLEIANGDLSLFKSGQTNVIHCYDWSGNKRTSMYHDGSIGIIYTSAGSLQLNPADNIDCNNNKLENVGNTTPEANKLLTLDSEAKFPAAVLRTHGTLQSKVSGSQTTSTWVAVVDVTGKGQLLSVRFRGSAGTDNPELRITIDGQALTVYTYTGNTNKFVTDMEGGIQDPPGVVLNLEYATSLKIEVKEATVATVFYDIWYNKIS